MMGRRLPLMFGEPDRARLNGIADHLELAISEGALHRDFTNPDIDYMRGLADEKDRRLAAAEKREHRVAESLAVAEQQRDRLLAFIREHRSDPELGAATSNDRWLYEMAEMIEGEAK